MPNPVTAYKQQAHKRTHFIVIARTTLFGLLLGVAGLLDPTPAETAILKELRMGDHGTYTRVVFEFSAPVQYQLSENATAGIVSIRFLDTTSELRGMPVSDAPDCIDTISIAQDGSHTIATISFDPKEVKLNPFTIQCPDRVVLDVFCEAAAVVAPVASAEPRISHRHRSR